MMLYALTSIWVISLLSSCNCRHRERFLCLPDDKQAHLPFLHQLLPCEVHVFLCFRCHFSIWGSSLQMAKCFFFYIIVLYLWSFCQIFCLVWRLGFVWLKNHTPWMRALMSAAVYIGYLWVCTCCPSRQRTQRSKCHVTWKETLVAVVTVEPDDIPASQ